MMKAAARDSPAAQAPMYKKGDIVWVYYRGKTEYPAKVTAYYPKERKVSHNWFPLSRESLKKVFKSDQSKVRPFTVNDDLPENSDAQLAYSYDQAINILKGASEEDVVNEYEQALAEIPKPASAKKKSTAELLKGAGGSQKTPKSAKGIPTTSGRKKQQAHYDQQYQDDEPIFEPGQQIIVDTQIGMWPGIFKDYVENEPEKIRYTLFPRKTSNEVLIGTKGNIIPFPVEQIENSINEGNGSEQLMEALNDALEYVHERMAQKGAGALEVTPIVPPIRAKKEPKEKIVQSKKPQVTTPNENIQKSPQQMKPAVRKMEPVNTPSDVEPMPTNNAKSAVQARLASKRQHSVSNSPGIKRRKLNLPEQDEPTEEERQISLFSPTRSRSDASQSVSPQKNAATNGHMMGTMEQQQKQQNMLDGVKKFEAREQDEDFVPESPQENEAAANIEKRSFFELAMSDDAHEHMRKIWSNIPDEWFKQLVNAESFHMDFRNGGLLSFNETEKLVAEVQQWIKLSTVPTLTHLREMFYIAKYVLPEVCTFALSKERSISMDEAKHLYEDRRVNHKNSPGPKDGSPTTSNSLDTLLMAANMIAGEQNGGVNGNNGS